MRVQHKDLFIPIANAIINGEEKLIIGEIEFKFTHKNGVLGLWMGNKKLADIPCGDDFEVVDKRAQSTVYNIINLAIYGEKE